MAPFREEIPYCSEPGQCLGSPNTQAAGIAIYQVGCMFGAIGVLFYGDKWGRRSSTFWGSFLMIFGTIFQVAMAGSPQTTYALFIVGRIIGGLGNGCVTSTIPTWQSECAKPKLRGMIIILSGAMIALGIMISYWVNYGFFFASGSIRWRFPIAFQVSHLLLPTISIQTDNDPTPLLSYQCVFTIFVMIGMFFLPDSPRWLLLKGRRQEAKAVIARLSGTTEDDPAVQAELKSIEEVLAVETNSSFKLLLERGPSQNLQRTIIAVAAQFFQQIGGINLLTYYLALLLEQSLGFAPDISRLISAANGTEYFLASLVAVFLVERVGRRKLMLVGAAGMSACMAIIAGTVSTGVVVDGSPVLGNGPGIAAVVMLFLFNTFFAIGWLGMSWLIPSEITNLRTRIRANALSTSANWVVNFLIVMISPPALANIGYRTYIIFAIFNACIVPCVYFFFPETSHRSLEEIDVIFASAHAEGKSAVKQSLTMPSLSGDELDVQLERYFGVEAINREKGVETQA